MIAFLQEEEAALAHVKRLSFRESLNNRMKEMGHLAQVMEDSAAEAVAILDSLHGPDGDFTPSAHHFDLGSDDGSIAPSQSASQAMSRSSSSSSLADQHGRHANGPAVPEDLPIDPNARPTSVVRRERSFSPTRSPDRAMSQVSMAQTSASIAAPVRAPAPLDRPVMPAVPTAPPPIAHTVYTERVPGMPTFDIPRAPDLSRRPDYSSESEYDDDEQHGYGRGGGRNGGGNSRIQPQTSRRSMRFSSVQPPSMNFSPRSQRSYGRRAMSESGSIDGREGRGRKRSGSFFGGIARLFGRGKKRDEEDDELENDYGRGGGGGGGYGRSAAQDEYDYAGARSQLARQQPSAPSVRSRNTTVTDARVDAVMDSVINAGRISRPATRAGNDSSDDEGPTSVVRHVNDPKARIKAMSDVGRSPAPRPAFTVAQQQPSATHRPKLQRKGTSSSSVRPMSAVGAPASDVAGANQRRPRKAASDIGIPPSRMNPALSNSLSSPTLQVPRAPSGPGIAELANGAMLPLARPAGPAFAPRGANTGTPSAPAETGTLMRKKTKKTKVDPREAQLANIVATVGTVQPRARPVSQQPPPQQQQQQTVVISAESLGMPTAAGSTQPSTLARSNTSTSATLAQAPAANGTLKKKKTVVKESALPPSADDLAASLPRAATGPSSFSAQLPRPDDDPTTFQPGPPQSLAAPVAAASAKKSESAKPVKTLADKEKKSKQMTALHGVSDSSWVAAPSSNSTSAASTQRATAMPTPPRRSDVQKGDESLMSIVDIAEGNENVKTSRSYASGTVTPTGSTLTVPVATHGKATPSWLSGGNGPSSTAMTPQLSKRKSVRLAETDPNAKPVALSPSPSMRSTSSSAAAGQPRHGILVHNSPGSVAASLSNGTAGGKKEDLWPTRASFRQRMQDSDDSSDEGEGMRAYRAARKMLGKETRGMESAMQGSAPREEKGKGRAD